MKRWIRPLLCVLAALAALALLAGLRAYRLGHQPWTPGHESEAHTLATPWDDVQLLSEQDKAWARQSGIGAYWWDGQLVVDEGLPESYWQPVWHE